MTLITLFIPMWVLIGPFNDTVEVLTAQVHWDHIGEPRDFPSSTFVVGHGALALLQGTSSTLRGGHSFFEHDLLPEDRTIELPDPHQTQVESNASIDSPCAGKLDLTQPWRSHGELPQTLDVFNDGSLLIVDAPGHLPGHINILARVSKDHLIYLGGDACHDRRLLTGEKEIGEWNDLEGHTCCIHANKKQAEETIQRIKKLEESGVEIIFGHDVEWEDANKRRFFGVVAINPL